MIRTLCTDVSLRWCQYRIIHRILGTNSFLNKIRVIDSNLCTFCNVSVWNYFTSILVMSNILPNLEGYQSLDKNELNIDIDFNGIDIIFGMALKIYPSINLIICIVKRYLYEQKKMNKCIPNIIDAKKYIKYYMNLDEYIYIRKMLITMLFLKMETVCSITLWVKTFIGILHFSYMYKLSQNFCCTKRWVQVYYVFCVEMCDVSMLY